MTDDEWVLEKLDRLLSEAHRFRDSSECLRRNMAEQAKKIKERHIDSLLREFQKRPRVIVH